jgi:predicted XRE-type DNA-binding protein
MNPAHLFAGTPKENMEDCASKDRNMFGEKVPWSKLTEEDVRRIRAAYATGEFSQKELALAYGVSQSNISQTVNGKTWARVA